MTAGGNKCALEKHPPPELSAKVVTIRMSENEMSLLASGSLLITAPMFAAIHSITVRDNAASTASIPD